MMYLGDKAVGLATSIPEFGDKVQIECGNYTPTNDDDINTKIFNHSLGCVPDFLIWIAESDIPLSSNYTEYYVVNNFITKKNVSGNNYNGYGYILYTNKQAASITAGRGNINIETYLTNNTFSLFAPDMKLKANVKYNYILGKFKEVTPNA